MTPPADAPVRKIAVVRRNALGDLMFALPALAALRAAYPGAEIVLLADTWQREFLEGRPSPVDRVVPVPGPIDATEAMAGFFAAMAAERFDVAVQLHGGGRHSNPFTRSLGAALTAGLRTPDAAPLDLVVPYLYFQHEVVRYLEVVALLGAAPVGLEPQVAVVDRDRAEADAVLAPLLARRRAPLVVVHPGATDARRRWPTSAFATVAAMLTGAGAQVVVTGTPPEAELTAAVARHAGVPVEDLCGRLSLSGLTGLLSKAALLVSNDSGPLHLAAAVGTPTVGIFWCANMINSSPLTRRLHRQAVSWRLACPVCGVDCLTGECTHRESFVADVPLDAVADPALELLAAGER